MPNRLKKYTVIILATPVCIVWDLTFLLIKELYNLAVKFDETGGEYLNRLISKYN